MAMTSDEIRDTYREFFEERGHLAQRGASLIPPPSDTSALFIVAGMHPLKAYFAGTEEPPSRRLTTCQPAFRTVDIENVGMTARHLTMFEMLGNFSFGDYFKREAISFAWDLSRNGFGLKEEDIWVTVFGGDAELGIGPDQEAIDLWLEVGMPRERIVECPREENFWESGPTGPCGPDSELYLDLGVERGKPDDLPGGENERFLEFWNLVFMQFDQRPPGQLTPLPNKNIDTGLGLNRMAAIKQGKETVLYVVGRKGLGYYNFRNRPVAQSWTGFSERPTYADAERATEAILPSFIVGTTVTKCPSNPLGIKGCGEAGAIAAPAAVVNAITDAIGSEDVAMPATSQVVWAAIRKANAARAAN